MDNTIKEIIRIFTKKLINPLLTLLEKIEINRKISALRFKTIPKSICKIYT